MNKWRYIEVVAKTTTLGDSVYAYSMKGAFTSARFLKREDSDKRASLSEFLNAAGEEGWEVCGMSPITGGASVSVLIILKKLTQDE